MIHHKSFTHEGTLDGRVYKMLKDVKTKKDYYLIVIDLLGDFCHLHKNSFDKSLFPKACNNSNTWNYDLTVESLSKNIIMEQSVKFGFGDYHLTDDDKQMVVKGQNHYNTKDDYYIAHTANVKDMGKYNPKIHSFQKVLKKKDGEELNIYIVRNLETRELHMLGVVIKSKMENINRKLDKTLYTKKVDIPSLLGKQFRDFIRYMNKIHIDYGRIELIYDEKLGWCIIDINNSPGGGILSEKYAKDVSDILKRIILKK